ncbi:hypothetical protein BH11BAC7_BH11BAC7_25040 [soil metagenome]
MNTTGFKFIMSATIVAVISIVACKKEEPEAPVTPVAPVVNTLCAGNGGTTFFPLVAADNWNYSYVIANQSQSVHPSLTVGPTVTHNAVVYTSVNESSSTMYGVALELRDNASNHDIYYYNTNNNTEYLYIPNTPTLNQSWTFGSNTRKVTNASASVTTANCTYTGLIEISEFNSSNALLQKEYYKRGLGLVYREDVDTFFSSVDKFTLTSVTLH